MVESHVFYPLGGLRISGGLNQVKPFSTGRGMPLYPSYEKGVRCMGRSEGESDWIGLICLVLGNTREPVDGVP